MDKRHGIIGSIHFILTRDTDLNLMQCDVYEECDTSIQFDSLNDDFKLIFVHRIFSFDYVIYTIYTSHRERERYVYCVLYIVKWNGNSPIISAHLLFARDFLSYFAALWIRRMLDTAWPNRDIVSNSRIVPLLSRYLQYHPANRIYDTDNNHFTVLTIQSI